ncbi:major facilitator superfamily domain-containing protein [Cytidiella melzeri]|nr:major facilitator superfamily domain-containing protein [Cytidiella melzeri]
MSSDLADRDAADHEKHSLTSAEKVDGVPRKWKVYDEYGTVEDKKLLSKVDLRLLPVLPLLYPLSFSDWSNMGNAKWSHYDRLYSRIPHISSLKRFDLQFWLPTLTFCWGIASIFQRLRHKPSQLVRDTLSRERHWRVAVFFGGAALAGAFGGVLAYAIGKMDGIGGKRGWQWIFILEGLLTVVVSVVAYWTVPTRSHKAKWLTEAERSRLLARLAADSDTANKEKFEWVYVRQAFTDHLAWGYALLFHGHAFVLYTLSLFMPTIIAGLRFASY